jgi:hypothetical protein
VAVKFWDAYLRTLVFEDGAARLGEGDLHANARRLYGWAPPA